MTTPKETPETQIGLPLPPLPEQAPIPFAQHATSFHQVDTDVREIRYDSDAPENRGRHFGAAFKTFGRKLRDGRIACKASDTTAKPVGGGMLSNGLPQLPKQPRVPFIMDVSTPDALTEATDGERLRIAQVAVSNLVD